MTKLIELIKAENIINILDRIYGNGEEIYEKFVSSKNNNIKLNEYIVLSLETENHKKVKLYGQKDGDDTSKLFLGEFNIDFHMRDLSFNKTIEVILSNIKNVKDSIIDELKEKFIDLPTTINFVEYNEDTKILILNNPCNGYKILKFILLDEKSIIDFFLNFLLNSKEFKNKIFDNDYIFNAYADDIEDTIIGILCKEGYGNEYYYREIEEAECKLIDLFKEKMITVFKI